MNTYLNKWLQRIEKILKMMIPQITNRQENGRRVSYSKEKLFINLPVGVSDMTRTVVTTQNDRKHAFTSPSLTTSLIEWIVYHDVLTDNDRL